jgi:hypothetical protein
MAQPFAIPARFVGPPQRANGGYAAGAIARQIGEPVTVRLHAPVPLETALWLTKAGAGRWDVVAEGGRVASATATSRAAIAETIGAHVPCPPSYPEALELSRGYAQFSQLRSSHCFVCGIARAEDDGLRIFPGPMGERPQVAAPWCPGPSVADESGQVASEVIWAALDCPGYFASFREGTFALLGELSVCIERPLEVGHAYVVLGFPIAHDGRKRKAGTVLFDRVGRRSAYGVATWIEVQQRSADWPAI